MAERALIEVCARLVGDPRLRPHLVAVLWIGSRSTDSDVHVGSDLDLQIILDEPDLSAVAALAAILRGHRNLDLSVLYLADIVDSAGKVRFQDGTKGPFFMYVLAQGELLYGRNVYADLLSGLADADLRSSLLFTVREYLQRLRVIAILGSGAAFEFKKYLIKLFLDVLVLDDVLKVSSVPRTSNVAIVELAARHFAFPQALQGHLHKLTDYSTTFSVEEETALLLAVESVVLRVMTES